MARAIWNGVVPAEGDDVVADGGCEASTQKGSGLLGRLRDRLGSSGRADPTAGHEHRHEDPHGHADDSPVVDLDDSSFEAGTEGQWTVVDFWAPWCGPCRAFHPIFDEAARHTEAIRFARCNVDESPRSASALGILSIPTVVLFDHSGNEVERIVGVPARRDLDRLLGLASASSHPAA